MAAITRKTAGAKSDAAADEVSEDLRNLTIEITTGKISRSQIADRIYRAYERFGCRYGYGNQPAGSLQARVQKRIQEALDYADEIENEKFLQNGGMSNPKESKEDKYANALRTLMSVSKEEPLIWKIPPCKSAHSAGAAG